jgi:deoxyribodipyrimidine photo-lyase
MRRGGTTVQSQLKTGSSSSSSSSTKLGGAAIVWFRSSDLRVHDHEPLSKAHANHDSVVHIYCFDDRAVGPRATIDFSRSLPAVGWPKTGYFRSRFLVDSVSDLRSTLEQRSGETVHGARSVIQSLFVRMGRPEQVLASLAAEIGASMIYCSEGEAPEEVETQKAVEAAIAVAGKGNSCRLHHCWENTMYHMDDLPFTVPSSSFPRSATEFKNAVEKRSRVRDPLPVPASWKPLPSVLDIANKGDIPAADALCGPDSVPEPFRGQEPRGVLPFRGGETAALARLEEYFFTTDSLKSYFSTRNGMIGPNYSSKFSPWLAHGCLSARLINAEVERYEREREKSKETYWMRFELTFRDYFKFYCRQHGSSVFKLYGPKGNSAKAKGGPEKEWSQDLALLEQWRTGCTGNPMIDANMRELYCTGFMSNRGRQIVASYLTRDMGVDWRLGAMHFESLLIDHDPCLNWGNWTYSAGVGSDPREDRYFSVSKQTTNYDPGHLFIKHWVPEVATMSAPELTKKLYLGTKQQRDGQKMLPPQPPAAAVSSDVVAPKVVTRSISKPKPNRNKNDSKKNSDTH